MNKRINRASDTIGIKGTIPIKKETLHPNKNYSIDEQIILLYLLSLPPQWNLKQDWIIHQYDGIMGRNRIKKAWASLKLKGHLIKKTGTNFTDVYWIVYELPIDRNPVYREPVHREPVDRELVHNNTKIKDTDNKETDNKENTSIILGKFENKEKDNYICNTNEQEMKYTPEQYQKYFEEYKKQNAYKLGIKIEDEIPTKKNDGFIAKQNVIDLEYKLQNEFYEVDRNVLFQAIKDGDENKLPLITKKQLTSTQKELCEKYREMIPQPERSEGNL